MQSNLQSLFIMYTRIYYSNTFEVFLSFLFVIKKKMKNSQKKKKAS